MRDGTAVSGSRTRPSGTRQDYAARAFPAPPGRLFQFGAVAMLGEGLTGVPGVRVGHYTDLDAATGCTVVLCEAGAVGGVDVRGSSPGTRETDLLRPTNLVSEVHAILLGGDSAFGRDVASGVVRYLEERGVAYEAGRTRVPIVPTAILFDLELVTDRVRPGPHEGLQAYRDASRSPIEEGSASAGTGATVGKILGMALAVKGGVGTSSVDLGEGLIVGAIVAVNALGSVFDPNTDALIAGPRGGDGERMRDSLELLTTPGFRRAARTAAANTTIGVVATNARLTKEEANKLASIAHDVLAMAVRPAHTMGDGDVMFAIGTGGLDRPADMYRLGAAAVLCMSSAIVRGVSSARGLGGVPGVSELAGHVEGGP